MRGPLPSVRSWTVSLLASPRERSRVAGSGRAVLGTPADTWHERAPSCRGSRVPQRDGRAGGRPSAGFREHRAVGGLLRGGGPRGFTRGHSYPPQRACFTSGTPKDGEFQGLLGGPKRCSVTAGTAAGCLQRRAIPPPDHSRRPGWAGTAEMRQAGARSRADSTSRGGGPGRGLRLLGARGAVSSSR